jgi:hypothetical protein
MYDLDYEFNNRMKDINSLFKSIGELILIPGQVVPVTIVKASLILNLYNIVECVFRMFLINIHNRYCDCSFKELNSDLKKIFVDYYFLKFDKNMGSNLEKILMGELKFPKFEDYEKKKKIISGNIDAKLINEVLKLYGLPVLDNPMKIHLLKVKNLRNKLAHGELTFKEVGRQLVLNDLKLYIDAVNETFSKLIRID